jgi:S-methylmethionine-dependent homocysteine/selenocysteine methylase
MDATWLDRLWSGDSEGAMCKTRQSKTESRREIKMTMLEQLLASPVPFLTDGGLETDLIFNDGCELPLFSAFVLLANEQGRTVLRRYFDRYLDIAEASVRGFVLDTATWRANAGWADRHGLTADDIRRINVEAVRFAREIRASRSWSDRILVNGNIGPTGDGYAPDRILTPDAAEALHRPQLEAFAAEGVDIAIALTMTHVGEAVGVARLAQELKIPLGLSFTVETDGRLPDGMALNTAIAATDEATGGSPLFYGVNCAHPSHFLGELKGSWIDRISVVRANASTLSHKELDEATELDDGDPEDFGRLYEELGRVLPNLRIVGGCCGSDCRHVAAAARAS